MPSNTRKDVTSKASTQTRKTNPGPHSCSSPTTLKQMRLAPAAGILYIIVLFLLSRSGMASDNPVIYDYSPYFRVYKDGSVERLMAEEQTPAGLDPLTSVNSKDISISTDVSARIYLPPLTSTSRKLSLILYFRGGGFCILSSASPILHRHLNDLAAISSSLILSVDYRRAPEHHIPVQYDDCWAALEWVASHRSDVGEKTDMF